jgi:hypothetical protein
MTIRDKICQLRYLEQERNRQKEIKDMMEAIYRTFGHHYQRTLMTIDQLKREIEGMKIDKRREVR